MNKITAVIPLLLGSTRIQDKNLILVDGYPLAFYVAKACRAAGIFDEIYINSENEIFENYAKQLEVHFYRRSANRGGSTCTMANKSMDCGGQRCQVHDHFLTDFLENVHTKYLVQVHSTSPLIRPETIRSFCENLLSGEWDSLFTVEELRVESFFNGKPLNFDITKKTKTQDLVPLQKLSWAISGWKGASFLESYYRDSVEEPGPTFVGRIGFYPIDPVEALDADTWDELFIIEACLNHQKRKKALGRFKFDERIVEIDSELARLIKRDGVHRFAQEGEYNKPLTRLLDVKEKMQGTSWFYPLIYTENDQCCLIAQAPGEGCRTHYHTTKDEWWIVIEGAFEWRLDDGRVIHAKPGEVVFLEKGTIHTIVCVSQVPGIRLACGGRDMEHIYVST
jgi:CMP-N-acetylneuraminic acid synthetase/mannose-6-phosphate isomerase-like protein (cupin superfamily)